MFKACASIFTFVSVISVPAQAPSPSTLGLSLKTMSHALSECRKSYTHSIPDSTEPLLLSVVGEENYKKDMLSLDHAETLVNGLVIRPDKVKGQYLVAILSSSDDFSIGVGSTRAEVLRHLVIDKSTSARQEALMLAAESLNNCQIGLFNAGDDFVDLVMKYVGAEDEAISKRSNRK